MHAAALATARAGIEPGKGSTLGAHPGWAALRNQHVLVLGGGGFLGSAITNALVARVGRISAILGPPGTDVVPAPREVRTGHLDICDTHALSSWLRGVDTVVHAAGPPSVAASFADPLAFARTHVLGTVSTLEACRHAEVRRLVYLSSAEIYGQPGINPVVERAPLAPLSPYGAAKMSAETFICADAGRSVGDALILRPFSVYGPGSPARSVVGSIMRQALAGTEIRVFDPRPIRDYCYIDDLATCVLKACASPVSAPMRIYNVGSGRGTSVADLTRQALEVAGRCLPLLIVGESDRPARAAIRELVADISKAGRELRWTPSTPLQRGLGQLMARLRERPS
jgi:nucleoside-diphosphate-sugar epimerase